MSPQACGGSKFWETLVYLFSLKTKMKRPRRKTLLNHIWKIIPKSDKRSEVLNLCLCVLCRKSLILKRRNQPLVFVSRSGYIVSVIFFGWKEHLIKHSWKKKFFLSITQKKKVFRAEYAEMKMFFLQLMERKWETKKDWFKILSIIDLSQTGEILKTVNSWNWAPTTMKIKKIYKG